MTVLWDLYDGTTHQNVSSFSPVIGVEAGQCGLNLMSSSKDNF